MERFEGQFKDQEEDDSLWIDLKETWTCGKDFRFKIFLTILDLITSLIRSGYEVRNGIKKIL